MPFDKDVLEAVRDEYAGFLESDKDYRDAIYEEAGVRTASEYLGVLLETVFDNAGLDD